MKFELAGALEAVPGSKKLEGSEQELLVVGLAQAGETDPRYSRAPWQPGDPDMVQPDVDKRLVIQVNRVAATQWGGWSGSKVQRASDPKSSAREAFGVLEKARLEVIRTSTAAGKRELVKEDPEVREALDYLFVSEAMRAHVFEELIYRVEEMEAIDQPKFNGDPISDRICGGVSRVLEGVSVKALGDEERLSALESLLSRVADAGRFEIYRGSTSGSTRSA